MPSILRANMPDTPQCENSDVLLQDFRSRTVSFSGESKKEDGDFILFPDHVTDPKTDTSIKKWLINRKSYTFLFGAAGCTYSASFRYFNGTITTIEKRFKIPSRNTAIISIGNDISQIFASILLTYYASGRNKPKWMMYSLYSMALYCLMSATPHFLYGPGKDALQFTEEYEPGQNITLIDLTRRSLCNKNDIISQKCDTEGGELTPQIILFMAQVLFGIAESIYYVFGLSYLDDNVSKSESPLFISISYLLKMLGPAAGYSIASFCLKYYIDPMLQPAITPTDPRWLGCWWAGWIFIGALLVIFGYLIGFFPKKLTNTCNENFQEEQSEKEHKVEAYICNSNEQKQLTEKKMESTISNSDKQIKTNDVPSFQGLKDSLTRLLNNKILMYNNLSTVFCLFGATPYWMFSTKYFELQYLQSASEASYKIGTISFFFSGIGVLISGIIISKLRPSARSLAAWNIFTSTVAVIGMIVNYYMGCEANDNVLSSGFNESRNCYSEDVCNCEFVKYSPVCGNNNQTYISACHAGCTDQQDTYFTNCSCIEDQNGIAYNGACPIDCNSSMMGFLLIIYIKKFLGASGLAGNFILSLRCVDEQDKPLSVGLMLMLTSLFAFIPAPIYFGINMDKACLVWGKTCTTNGNCWLYDGREMRFAMNIIGAIFVFIGTCLDGGVWYYAKNLKVFDEKNINDIEEHNNKNCNSE